MTSTRAPTPTRAPAPTPASSGTRSSSRKSRRVLRTLSRRMMYPMRRVLMLVLRIEAGARTLIVCRCVTASRTLSLHPKVYFLCYISSLIINKPGSDKHARANAHHSTHTNASARRLQGPLREGPLNVPRALSRRMMYPMRRVLVPVLVHGGWRVHARRLTAVRASRTLSVHLKGVLLVTYFEPIS
jgi:hypothetical protein